MRIKEHAPVLPNIFGPKSVYKSTHEESWQHEWPREKHPTPEDHERCRRDRRWLHVVKCKFGHLFQQGESLVGYSGKGSVRLAALLQIPGVVLHQRGDVEFNVFFPESCLAQVEQIVFPRRRQVLSPAQKAERASRLKQSAP